MAKRKRRYRARRSGGFFKRFKRSRRASRGLGIGGVLIGGAVYGAGRQFISSKLTPVTSKIPLGNLADNLVMGVISYYVAKKVRNPTIKEIGKAGLYIESALAGQDLMAGSLGNGGGVVSSSTTW